MKCFTCHSMTDLCVNNGRIACFDCVRELDLEGFMPVKAKTVAEQLINVLSVELVDREISTCTEKMIKVHELELILSLRTESKETKLYLSRAQVLLRKIELRLTGLEIKKDELEGYSWKEVFDV